MKNSVGCGKPSVSLNMNNPLEHTSVTILLENATENPLEMPLKIHDDF